VESLWEPDPGSTATTAFTATWITATTPATVTEGRYRAVVTGPSITSRATKREMDRATQATPATTGTMNVLSPDIAAAAVVAVGTMAAIMVEIMAATTAAAIMVVTTADTTRSELIIRS